MNNNTRNRQENLEDKLYTIDRNDPIFQIDENDPMYKEILENEESEIKEDLQFRSLINSLNFHKCSNIVEEKVMNAYQKEYRYRIFLYKVKVRFAKYRKSLFSSKRGLEIALASFIILFILGTAVYYQYITNQNTEMIVNQSETKVTPIEEVSRTSFITDPRSLTSIRNIYIELIGNSKDIGDFQKQIFDALDNNNFLKITEQKNADAVLRGTIDEKNNKLFVRLVDKKGDIIWRANIELINKNYIGSNIVKMLITDIDKVKNRNLWDQIWQLFS